MRSDDMIMGDLDDCIDCLFDFFSFIRFSPIFLVQSTNQSQLINRPIPVTLRCQQDAMIVRGRSLRLLNANVKPRAVIDSIVPVVGRLADCQLSVHDTFEFQTKIDYDVCGTKKEV